ncbi:MAG TPA: hypothetical protein VK629_09250 [Steroidobacteraceae bacterium]|nr:hypothetical protein [Steroidobacteraceae bacterium]
MNVNELLDTVRSAGITPILVDAVPVDRSGVTPVGTLEDYAKALRALGVSVVLVETVALDDEDFYYVDDESDEDNEGARMDLRSASPKLRSFEARIGEVGFIRFWAPSSHGDLVHEIADDWWPSFCELADTARDDIETRLSAEIEQRDIEEENQRKKGLELLGQLIEDASFQKLRTQRAMLEYALENYPDLQEWDTSDLKDEIRSLAAKLEIRRTRGK